MLDTVGTKLVVPLMYAFIYNDQKLGVVLALWQGHKV